MAVSVRMDPLLEKELELAASRQGVTKSQFIIDAVERALGARILRSCTTKSWRRLHATRSARVLRTPNLPPIKPPCARACAKRIRSSKTTTPLTWQSGASREELPA